ncbi:MAG: hypothetical protein NTW79_00790 [Candidatus Berkelbacteria bacterium]|nr:hypothetical protein [Candidatus Berkelbacteria bacterium]
MRNIASPSLKQFLDRTTQCMTRLIDDGLTYDDLKLVIDEPEFGPALVEFWHNWESASKPSILSILEFASEFNCVTVESFNPAEMLVVGKAGIVWRSQEAIEFIEKHLPVETEVKPATVCGYDLVGSAMLQQIADEITEERMLVASQLWQALNNQSQKQDGVLRTDWWNIIPVAGTKRAFYCRWDSALGGRCLYAGPFSRPYLRSPVRRVLALPIPRPFDPLSL